jgi:hypothetical protein
VRTPDERICDADLGFCVECRDDLDCYDERCRASECEAPDDDDD